MANRLCSRLMCRPDAVGILLGGLFCCASFAPSLIPRGMLAQALLSGISLTVGYALGALLRWTGAYLGLPSPRPSVRAALIAVMGGVVAICLFLSLWYGHQAQNDTRLLMGMLPQGGLWLAGVVSVALLCAVLLILMGRLVGMVMRGIAHVVAIRVPRRLANVVGVFAGGLLLAGLLNGVVARSVLDMLDLSYQHADAWIPPDVPPPAASDSPGGPASLIAWNKLGYKGRRFVSERPSEAELAGFFGSDDVKTPLRVYVGLPAAETPQQRAMLALQELQRVGGFARKALVIITPTGTGWVDPAGIESLEYLYRGDVASVAVQYSYLSSPLTLLLDQDAGQSDASALFEAVYTHWASLPRDARPKLFLHGLSLGALNSERSFELFDLLGDPFDGAVWSGPPFAAARWAALTRARVPGSPVWLPRFRDGSAVRFMNQDGVSASPDAPWGLMRIMYLQYGSDAVTFFDPHAAFRSPELLQHPRPPDIPDSMRWYPLVTMLQMSMDLPLSMTTPMGFGHVYAPSHYVRAWHEVAGLTDWTPSEMARLQGYLDARRASALSLTTPGGG